MACITFENYSQCQEVEYLDDDGCWCEAQVVEDDGGDKVTLRFPKFRLKYMGLYGKDRVRIPPEVRLIKRNHHSRIHFNTIVKGDTISFRTDDKEESGEVAVNDYRVAIFTLKDGKEVLYELVTNIQYQMQESVENNHCESPEASSPEPPGPSLRKRKSQTEPDLKAKIKETQNKRHRKPSYLMQESVENNCESPGPSPSPERSGPSLRKRKMRTEPEIKESHKKGPRKPSTSDVTPKSKSTKPCKPSQGNRTVLPPLVLTEDDGNGETMKLVNEKYTAVFKVINNQVVYAGCVETVPDEEAKPIQNTDRCSVFMSPKYASSLREKKTKSKSLSESSSQNHPSQPSKVSNNSSTSDTLTSMPSCSEHYEKHDKDPEISETSATKDIIGLNGSVAEEPSHLSNGNKCAGCDGLMISVNVLQNSCRKLKSIVEKQRKAIQMMDAKLDKLENVAKSCQSLNGTALNQHTMIKKIDLKLDKVTDDVAKRCGPERAEHQRLEDSAEIQASIESIHAKLDLILVKLEENAAQFCRAQRWSPGREPGCNKASPGCASSETESMHKQKVQFVDDCKLQVYEWQKSCIELLEKENPRQTIRGILDILSKEDLKFSALGIRGVNQVPTEIRDAITAYLFETYGDKLKMDMKAVHRTINNEYAMARHSVVCNQGQQEDLD